MLTWHGIPCRVERTASTLGLWLRGWVRRCGRGWGCLLPAGKLAYSRRTRFVTFSMPCINPVLSDAPQHPLKVPSLRQRLPHRQLLLLLLLLLLRLLLLLCCYYYYCYYCCYYYYYYYFYYYCYSSSEEDSMFTIDDDDIFLS